MTLEEILAALQALIDDARGRDITADEADLAADLAAQAERAAARSAAPQAVVTRDALTRAGLIPAQGVARRMHAEFRAEVEATGKLLRGHAAIFGAEAEIFPGFCEELAPTAFDDVLTRPGLDVRALRDHNPSMVLGRTASGTLRLGVDSVGLEFEADLPNTSYANDLRELVARGDVTGASFGFIPGAEVLSRSASGAELCTHTSISDLLDVSPVTFPAYGGTDVALRARTPAAGPAQLLTIPSGRPVRLIRAQAHLLIGRNA